MSSKSMEFYRLEDRVLFEAAAAVEIVEAAENNNDPNANMNEADRQAQEARDAIKNAPPENPAAQADADQGYLPDLSDLADWSDLSDIPGVEAGLDPEIDALITDIFAPQLPEGDLLHLALNNNGETVSTGKELVIINSSVMDADTIIDTLAPNQEVLRLEAGSDAMQQILDYLDSADTKYDSIHIVSHGNAGYFVLNGEVFDGENFDAAEWAAVGEHVSENGDILLYGCNLAENAAGRDFIAQIADASGADVAASTNTTGISGDWTLEYSHGLIETTSISVDAYEYRLNNIQVTVDADSGAGSLRQAVGDASSGDEITFNASVTKINLSSKIVIDKDLTISGNVNADGVAATEIVISTADRIFTINSDYTVTLNNLILTGSNTIAFAGGGVIFVDPDAVLTLDNVTVRNGVANDGGGVYAHIGSTINVNNSTISGNSAVYNGGGISGDTGSTINVNNSTISGNSAEYSGGGIFGEGTIMLTNSTVSDNSAGSFGGGIFNTGILIVANSTISGNSAHYGGGIAVGDVSSVGVYLKMTNSTVAGNYVSALSDTGGGIYIHSAQSVQIANSIIVGNFWINSGNEAKSISDIYCSQKPAGAYQIVYSVYGSLVNEQSAPNTLGNQSGVTVENTFGTGVNLVKQTGGNWLLVKADGTTPILQNGVMPILTTSAAATSGTATAFENSDGGPWINFVHNSIWYFLNTNGQIQPVDEGSRAFDPTGKDNYGLGVNTSSITYTVFSRDQEGYSRMGGASYSAGAVEAITAAEVTTTADIVVAGFTSLREAITMVNSSPTWRQFDRIVFADRIFTNNVATITITSALPQLAASVSIDGGAGRNVTVTVPVTGRSFNAATQQWEDNADSSTFRVFNIAAGTTVSLSNLTLLGGDVGGNSGGVIYLASNNNNPSTLNLDKVTVQGGKASNGGGIYGEGTINVNHSVITNNSVIGDNLNGGGIFGSGTINVNYSEITNNSVTGGNTRGGGIYGYDTVTVENSTISGNSVSNDGGGIYGNGAVTVKNSTISGNSAGTFGGGIFGESTITVVNSTISGNSATSFVGGIYGGGTVNILNSIVVGNYAGETSTADDIFARGALNMKYSVYGVVGGATPDATNTRATVQQVFGAAVKWAARTGTGAAYELVYGDGTPVFNGKTMVISADGAAAYKGTLTAKIGDVLWYKDGAVWRNFTDDTTKNFTDNAADNYGLGVDIGTQVYTTAQNLDGNDDPVSRVQTTAMFNVGAYALNVTAKSDSLVVSTTTDWLNNVFSAKTSLREALAYAATQAGSQNITFNASIYTANAVTITLDPGYGELKITSSVSISGLAGKTTTVTVPVTGRSFNTTTQQWEDNANPSAFRVFDIAAGTTVSLANLTLLGGDVGGNISNYGGVIYLASDNNNPSTLNLDKVTVQGGKASIGGGIFGGNNSAVTLTNSTVSGNSAGVGGGGIYGNGAVTLTNSTVSGNSAAQGGGGIFGFGTIMVENSTISGNSAEYDGGGIYGYGAVTLTNSTISGNSADNGSGGGLYGEGTVTVENSTISGNSATGNNGGGIYGGTNSAVTVENSTISSNSADNGSGGGIYGLGTITVVNSTISGNAADNNGGIFGGGTVNILNSIVVGNYVGETSNASDIYAAGALNMKYSVYGAVGGATVDATNIRSTVAEVFGAEWAEVGGKWTLVEIGTTTPILQNGVMAISADGAAAYLGTLTATGANGELYYRDMGSDEWYMVGDDITTYGDFVNDPNQNYGLTAAGATVLMTAQNGIDRVQTDLAYNVGAYGLDTVGKGLTVTTDVDWVNPFAGGVSLREALIYAASLGGTQYISFDSGISQIELSTRYEELEIESNVTIDGGNGVTISVKDSGLDTAADHRVFEIDGGLEVILYNLTLLGGDISGQFGDEAHGGVIWTGADSTLTLDNTTVSNGKALNGGGIYGSTGSMITLNNSTVSDNSVIANGGGIYGDANSMVTLNTSVVSGNSADFNGGGIYGGEYSTITLNATTISGNSADFNGGGIYGSSGSMVTLNSSTASGNSADFNGGGIFSEANSTTMLNSSTVSGNSAVNAGGGVYGHTDSKVIAVNATVSGNSAGMGGGIYGYTDSRITVVNSTVSGNSAGSYGGGICTVGTVMVLNSIVLGNYKMGDPTAAGSADDIVAFGALDMQYSVYGAVNSTVSETNIQSDIARIFGAEWAEVGGKWTLVEIGTTTPILQNGVMPILETSAAAGKGVLVGIDINGIYYYSPDGITWYDLNGSAAGQPDTVYRFDQKGDFRGWPYSIGALDSNYVPPQYSLVVDSFDDSIDWTDGVNTLREALEAANKGGVAYNWDSNGDGTLDGYQITFDAALGDDFTITLNALLGELVLSSNIFIDGGVTSRNISITVAVVGMTAHRVFNIADSMTVQLDNLTLKGGDVSSLANNYGGVILAGNDSNLTLNNSTVTGGKATFGGGIFGYGTITVENSTISGNSAGAFGGGISSDTITVINSTVSGNSANLDGGGIYGGTITVENSTISGNTAGSYGGGIYSGATAMIVNSTVAGNTATEGGGIYNFDGTVTLLNSIVLGNYSISGMANDIRTYDDSVTDSDAFYCVIGAVSGKALRTDVGNVKNATVADVFGAEWAEVGGKWTLVKIGTTTPILQNGVMAVLETGAATGNGVLTGSYDDNGVTRYAYWNGSGWTDVDGSEVTATVTAISHDQKGDIRTEPYSIGALDSAYVPPPVYSLVVDSFDDVIDWTDGVTTLREAIISANHRGVAYNWDSNGDGTLDGYQITFDAALGDDFTITLNALLGELVLSSNIFIDGGDTSRNITVTVENVGVTQHRVFNIANNMTAQFDNLTLKGGDISGLVDGAGGVIYAGSGTNLTLNNSTVANGKATWGGGIVGSGTINVNHSKITNNSLTGDNRYGGGIYGSGTINVTYSEITNNSVTGGNTKGGGIYGGTSSTITVENSTISGNSAGSGGGIYGGSSSTITVANSTISGNEASSSGGGIFGSNNSTITVVNSTISGNSAEYGGGGIYGYVTVNILNSIVVGNYAGETSNAYDIQVWGALNMKYSVYGAVSGGQTPDATNIRSNVADVFGAEWAEVGGKWTLVKIGTTTPILQDGVMAILTSSQAAGRGVLTGTDGNGNYYYSPDGSEWFDLDGNVTLEPVTVYTLDQKGDTRTAPYSIGALDSAYIPPSYSLVVDSFDDVIDWTDGVNTLREAIEAANKGGVDYNWDSNGDGILDGYRITFDTVLGDVFTITLDSMLGELALAANIFIDGGATSRNITITVAEVGVTAHRVFNIMGGMTVQLDNLTLKGGDISGLSLDDSWGGVIYAGYGSDLTLNYTTIIGGKAAYGGGIESFGNLTLNDSTVSGNSAEYYGGGIDFDSNGDLTLINSTISGNIAGGNGGGIYGNGTITVENSTISGNSAGVGGGISGDTVTVINSTVSGNSAEYGGGISGDTVTVVNSTISGNSASSNGGGIFGFGAITVLNSIVLGNYSGGDTATADDIYYFSDEYYSATLTMEYSVYGTVSKGDTTTREPVTVSTTNIQSNVAEVFGAEWAEVGGKWTLVEIGTTTPILQQGVMAVQIDGPAADGGVLTGSDGSGNYYYLLNGSDWFDLDGGAAAQPAIVFTTDQKGDVRNSPYSIGALDSAYVPEPTEDPSLMVTTLDDIVDAYDGVISLREALIYAYTNPELGYTITFADALFNGGNEITITIDSELMILTSQLVVDGGFGRTVTVKVQETGVSDYRVFTASVLADWDLTFRNLHLQGGDVSGDGGAVYVSGATVNVTLENSTISGSRASSIGGAISVYGSDSLILDIINSTISGNQATQGGGIDAYGGNVTVNIINSTIAGNTGGGIVFYNDTVLNLINSIILGNYDTEGDGDDIYFVNDGTFNAAYSIYGAYDNTIGGDRSMGNIEDAAVEDVFTGEFVDGVLAIRADGPAAGNGTLAGYGNGDFYFMHNDAWVSFTGNGTPTEIFIFAQNRDEDGDPVRRDEGDTYSIGAYAIDATPVPPVDDDGGNRITSSGLYLDYSSTLPNMQVVEAMRNSEANFASSVGNTGFNQSAARTYTEYLSTIGAGFSWSSGRPYGVLPGTPVYGDFRPAWAGGSSSDRPGLGEAFESINEMQDIHADIVELELPGATREGQFTFGGNPLNGPHFVSGWSRDGVDQLTLTDTAETKVSGNAMFAYLDEALPPIVRRPAVPALASDLPELAAVEIAELDKVDAFRSTFDRAIEEILTI